MKKLKDKLLKRISSIIGVMALLLITLMVLNTEVLATEKHTMKATIPHHGEKEKYKGLKKKII